MAEANQEIQVIAEAIAKPGQEDALRGVLYACVAPTRAEHGNRAYILHEDLDKPGRFFFYETWASRESLAEHMKTPHFKTLDKNAKPLIAQPLTVAIVRSLDEPGI
jgi:quinol monooxygenase YgiN